MVENIAKQIKKRTDLVPEIGLILGSGWGVVCDQIEDGVVIPYSELEGMPTCTVKGHGGNFIIGKLFGKVVCVMQGRFHLYEGHSAKTATLPLFVMKAIGVSKVVITNAAGGVNASYSVGDIMIINDHINLSGDNPLIGVRATDERPIFVDMASIYNKEYIDILSKACEENNIPYHAGTYLQLKGPNYETPAEIRMAQTIGVDAVGMSTVCEVIAARYLNLKVAGISCITNMAAGISKTMLNHKEVLEVTEKNKVNFKVILRELISKM